MNAGWVTLVVIAVIASLFLIFWLYLKFSTGRDNSPTCLVGKTAIVTGANAGIGFYTAQDFAKRGARVILACRNLVKAEEAKTKIIEATGNKNIVVRIVDLTSLASVRKFAVETKATEDRVDILVNNAGVVGLKHSYTQDGLSIIMQTNYFGPFLLTVLLLDLLKKSTPSRIVNVTSVAAFTAKLNVNDLNSPSVSILPENVATYANSKLCNILFTIELARRLKGTGVDTNCLHPGVIKTEILRHLTGVIKVIFTAVVNACKTAEEGAQTSIYLAVSKEVVGISGEYFSDCKKQKMVGAARNAELARKLWERSEGLVRITAEEKQLI